MEWSYVGVVNGVELCGGGEVELCGGGEWSGAMWG